jgi:hypothetical protein
MLNIYFYFFLRFFSLDFLFFLFFLSFFIHLELRSHSDRIKISLCQCKRKHFSYNCITIHNILNSNLLNLLRNNYIFIFILYFDYTNISHIIRTHKFITSICFECRCISLFNISHKFTMLSDI